MSTAIMTSAQALAYGALVSGVKDVTTYPGSPTSETGEVLVTLAECHDLHVKWSSNDPGASLWGIAINRPVTYAKAQPPIGFDLAALRPTVPVRMSVIAEVPNSMIGVFLENRGCPRTRDIL
jgi:TPP-dependent indolepyruvate ferredoxin oxidoreductase alpha subunit